MPIIRVEMCAGRTASQKRKLVRALTEAFTSTCGGKPHDVNIVITDVAPENWGNAGAIASETEHPRP